VTVVLLARHGQTDWNRDQRFQGHADPPLNETGRAQAVALADQLRDVPVSAVYSSDLRRAVETASVVAAAKGLTVRTRPVLREIDVGEWSGLTVSEIEARYPDAMHRHAAGGDGWERGEPHAAMQERIVAAVSELTAAHPGETILLVGHGGTMRALMARAAGIPFPEYRRTHRGIRNGSVSRIAVEAGILRPLD
jgi:broad specificity phosphatase PhoE